MKNLQPSMMAALALSGALVASGPARLLARSTVVREAYLGAQAEDTTSAADAARRGRATAAPAS